MKIELINENMPNIDNPTNVAPVIDANIFITLVAFLIFEIFLQIGSAFNKCLDCPLETILPLLFALTEGMDSS
jgi:hypothetical protein